MLVPLVIFMLLFGLWPKPIVDLIHTASTTILSAAATNLAPVAQAAQLVLPHVR
jgi:NADH:ubiquinone oxidoreductase subunit 4 (subunit M)